MTDKTEMVMVPRCDLERAAETLDQDGDEHGVAAALRGLLAAAPHPPAEAQPVCTCPSGDGSLRWPCPKHPPPSAPVGVAAEDALTRALADAYASGAEGAPFPFADCARQVHAALAHQPTAVGGPYRLVDDVVTVNGIALDEVVKLGGRYAATIEKRGMPRAAQVFEALVLIGQHALAGQQGGER